MPKHPRRRSRRKLAALALSVLCLAGFLYWSNTALQVTRFSPAFTDLPAGFDGCRIVVLSDLHGAGFGRHHQDLFDKVAAEQPEYIFFLGDLEDKYRGPEDGYAAEIARGLSAIAPTYYVTGNHEWAIGEVPKLKEILAANGVTVLSNQFVTLERNGDAIVLAGIDDPNGYADQKTPEELAAEVYAAHGDPFWILLAHRNNRFASQYSLLGRIWCVPATPTGASSACRLRTGWCPTTWICSPPTPPGCTRKTALCCSSPGDWGTPVPPSGCSTGRRWRW